MRLRTKIFLGCFLLFELLFNAGSFFLIESNFRTAQDDTVRAVLAEQTNFYQGLQSTGQVSLITVEATSTQFGPIIQRSFDRYMEAFQSTGTQIALYDPQAQTMVYRSSRIAALDAGGQLDATQTKRSYTIEKAGKTSFLVVAQSMSLGKKDFSFIYASNVDALYRAHLQQYLLLLGANVALMLFLLIGLWLMLRKPLGALRNLTESAASISQGRYQQRAKVMSDDEIGELARSFNMMATTIEETVVELREQAHAQEEFSRSITHEIRTPLTAIISAAELARDSADHPDHIGLLNKSTGLIIQEARRLSAMSEKLRTIILYKQGLTDACALDLVRLLEDMRPWLEQVTAEHQIELRARLDPAVVVGDVELLRQLVINLVNNALRAMAPGGRLTITTGVSRSTGQPGLLITDTGSGIAQVDLAHLEEPFYTADRSRSRQSGGLGLGLALVRQIVEAHGAKISFESSEGVGTRVKISFPQDTSLRQVGEDLDESPA